MSYKTILVSLNDINRVEEIAGLACLVAGRFAAQVIGVIVTPKVAAYAMPGAYVTSQVTEALEAGYRQQEEKARASFEAHLAREGLSGDFRHIKSDSTDIASVVVDQGRQADLVVVGQHQPEGTPGIEPNFVSTVVMELGRPVLVVPYAGHFTSIGERAVVGWNASQEASRAVFDALPLLKDATQVWLAWADPQAEPDRAGQLPGSEIAATLARHGVKATTYSTPSGDISAGDAILNYAADCDADLAVIGAYGHSRLREYVFGGVTSTFLDHMTMPVLMSH
ncbi:MAG: universal stress protein [Hyphomicrobiales bacterium]|nr:universal stress protein [Hyphomicrobiales bacterium]